MNAHWYRCDYATHAKDDFANVGVRIYVAATALMNPAKFQQSPEIT
jgi:hypothetical protein